MSHTDSKALVLFSGGQDSTTCLYWALKRFAGVRALGFDYGQQHAVELRQATRLAEHAGVPFRVVDVRGALGRSALTEAGAALDARREGDVARPAAFVPARNALFLTLAASQAYDDGITDLVLGVCGADAQGFPDCRPDFVAAMQTALSAALERTLTIHAPLITLSKAEIWRLAADLDIVDLIVEETHTDYHGDRSTRHPWGYGRLDHDATRLRAEGFEEARRRGWI